jgi:hypothetical protein
MIKMIFMISAATQTFPSFGGAGEVHKNHTKITVQTTGDANTATVKRTSFLPYSKQQNKLSSHRTYPYKQTSLPHFKLGNEVVLRACRSRATEVVLSEKSGKNEVFIPFLWRGRGGSQKSYENHSSDNNWSAAENPKKSSYRHGQRL